LSELPKDWLEGVDIESMLKSEEYNEDVNKYKVKAGQGLRDWETAGWIRSCDPRGWFQWYCRFYLGRRNGDDDRQVQRWSGVAGPNGRWKKDLVRKIVRSGKSYDDESVSAVVRQTLQHWAYKLTESDYDALV